MMRISAWLVLSAIPLLFTACDSDLCVPFDPDQEPTYVYIAFDEYGNLSYDNECDSWYDYDQLCEYVTIEWCCADYTSLADDDYYYAHVELSYVNCGYGWQLQKERIGDGFCDFSCSDNYRGSYHRF